MNYYRSFFLLFFAVFLAGCAEEELVEKRQSKRTLLAYIAMDNDLFAEAPETVEALLSGWSPQMGRLFIFTDRLGEQPVLMQALRKEGRTIVDTLKRYENSNSASAALMSEVIGDMKQHDEKASGYGLLLFSHATGWLPKGAFKEPLDWEASKKNRSLFVDGTDEMELADFADAVPDNFFDFIAGEMCFMAGLEVVYALRNKTPYLLFSAAEILSPGFVPIYKRSLSKLYEPKADLEAFADAFFNQVNALEGPHRSATISLMDTKQVDYLVALMAELKDKPLSEEQIDRIQHFDRKRKPWLFFDLRDYLETVVTTYFDKEEATDWLKRMDKLLAEIILLERHTQRMINIPVKKHCGLSVYIQQDNLPRINLAWRSTALGKAINN